MYFITTKRMLEVCFFQHTPTFIIEPKKIVRAIDMCLQANGDCRGHSENGSGYIFIDLYID